MALGGLGIAQVQCAQKGSQWAAGACVGQWMKGMRYVLDSCVPSPHCRKPRQWGPWRG